MITTTLEDLNNANQSGALDAVASVRLLGDAAWKRVLGLEKIDETLKAMQREAKTAAKHHGIEKTDPCAPGWDAFLAETKALGAVVVTLDEVEPLSLADLEKAEISPKQMILLKRCGMLVVADSTHSPK